MQANFGWFYENMKNFPNPMSFPWVMIDGVIKMAPAACAPDVTR